MPIGKKTSIAKQFMNLLVLLVTFGLFLACPASGEQSNASTTIPQNGLVGYWSFNEGTGSTAHDQSGNGFHGEVYGAQWAAGVNGTALDFDGVDDYVQLVVPTVLDPHEEAYTIAAWVYAVSTDHPSKFVFVQTRPNGRHTNHALTIYQIDEYLPAGGGLRFETDLLGEWHHIAAVYSSGTAWLYVDGQLDATGPLEDYTGDTPTLTRFGDRCDLYGSTYNFDGLIDEIAVYDRALSPTDIVSLYQASGEAPGIVVAGTASSLSTGLPLSDVTFQLIRSGLAVSESSTTEDGTCLMSYTPGNNSYYYVVRATYQDQTVEELLGWLAGGDYVEVSFSLASGTFVTGRVYDSFNEAPISSATVVLREVQSGVVVATTSTNSTGVYTFDEDNPGEYRLEAFKDGPIGSIAFPDVDRLYRERSTQSTYTISPGGGHLEIEPLELDSRVVVLAHGIQSSPSMWTIMEYPDALRQHDWAVLDDVVFPGQWACADINGTADLSTQASYLRQRISDIGVRSVHVIAHSQGGVVSRLMNERSSIVGCNDCPPVVNRMITLATPHHGSPIGAIGYPLIWIATRICDNAAGFLMGFTLEERIQSFLGQAPAYANLYPNSALMRYLNQGLSSSNDWSGSCLFDNPNGETNLLNETTYVTVTCTGPISEWGNYVLNRGNAIGASLLAIGPHYCASDGMVPWESSRLHQEGANVYNYLDSEIGSHYIFNHNNVYYDSGIRDWAIDALAGPLAAPSLELPAEMQVVLERTRGDWTGGGFLDLVVPSGTVQVDSFYVDVCDTLHLDWFWLGGQSRSHLINPEGTVIDSLYAESHPEVLFLEDEVLAIGACQVPDPVAGWWRLQSNVDANESPSSIQGAVFQNRAISLLVNTDPVEPDPFSDRVVTVQIDDPNGVAITDASVSTDWLAPDGSSGFLELVDDGTGDDLVSGDGIYSGRLLPASIPGTTVLTVSASGDTPTPFHRSALASVVELATGDVYIAAGSLVAESNTHRAFDPVSISAQVANCHFSPSCPRYFHNHSPVEVVIFSQSFPTSGPIFS